MNKSHEGTPADKSQLLKEALERALMVQAELRERLIQLLQNRRLLAMASMR